MKQAKTPEQATIGTDLQNNKKLSRAIYPAKAFLYALQLREAFFVILLKNECVNLCKHPNRKNN